MHRRVSFGNELVGQVTDKDVSFVNIAVNELLAVREMHGLKQATRKPLEPHARFKVWRRLEVMQSLIASIGNYATGTVQLKRVVHVHDVWMADESQCLKFLESAVLD